MQSSAVRNSVLCMKTGCCGKEMVSSVHETQNNTQVIEVCPFTKIVCYNHHKTVSDLNIKVYGSHLSAFSKEVKDWNKTTTNLI